MDRAKFYAKVRETVTSGKLTTEQVNGFEAILNEWDRRAEVNHGVYGYRGYLSYMLATAYWETNHTMQPVREAYWLSENWRKKNLRYYPWYGRGLVQLTWKYNYEKADKKLGLGGKLIANPDLAMDPSVAVPIMFTGMEEGWFTGKSLADYRENGKQNFKNDRHIINGTDHDGDIASIADHFDAAILAAVA
jgi:putative chitinase